MLKLISPAFPANGEMPERYTAEGENISPPLTIQDVPEGARSLVLFATDPDAPDPAHPARPVHHWVLYNLPPDLPSLPQDAEHDGLPAGVVVGMNSTGSRGYLGPKPPVGRHRYLFQLYALDTKLPELSEPTRDQVEREMDGHILARTALLSTYESKRGAGS
jgi:Raf kinase inhibitor-like YbhB/YbcL family protein